MRIRLEQLQKPKEARALALPIPWLYYLAAQLQHIARAMPNESHTEDPTTVLLRHVTGSYSVATGLEALSFAKSNKRFPTYVLMQKVWNKVRQ